MITKDQFITIIKRYQKVDDTLELLRKAKIDIIESNILDSYWRDVDLIWELTFNINGIDWINWWMFEKQSDNSLQAYDENHNIIPTETIDDLWDLVKDDRI